MCVSIRLGDIVVYGCAWLYATMVSVSSVTGSWGRRLFDHTKKEKNWRSSSSVMWWSKKLWWNQYELSDTKIRHKHCTYSSWRTNHTQGVLWLYCNVLYNTLLYILNSLGVNQDRRSKKQQRIGNSQSLVSPNTCLKAGHRLSDTKHRARMAERSDTWWHTRSNWFKDKLLTLASAQSAETEMTIHVGRSSKLL